MEKGKSFGEHRDRYHSIWNYVNFIFYLSTLRGYDMDGKEFQVWNKLTTGKKDFDWIPKDETMDLGNFIKNKFDRWRGR